MVKLEKKLMMAAAVVAHLTGIYVVGAEHDEWLCVYEANLPSLLFVISVMLLVVQYCLCPKTILPLPNLYLLIYNVIMALLISSMALRLIWLPLTFAITKFNCKTAELLKSCSTFQKSPFDMVPCFLESRFLHNAEILLISALNFGSVVKGIGIYDYCIRKLQELKARKIREIEQCEDEGNSSRGRQPTKGSENPHHHRSRDDSREDEPSPIDRQRRKRRNCEYNID